MCSCTCHLCGGARGAGRGCWISWNVVAVGSKPATVVLRPKRRFSGRILLTAESSFQSPLCVLRCLFTSVAEVISVTETVCSTK